MKLKPIVKVNESKNYLTSWIIEKFPENYRELKYVELFLGGSTVLLNKDPSVEEVGNDLDINVLRIWQCIRDEPKLFTSKLKKIECKEKTFVRYQNKKETDYLNVAIVEFVLRQMSKSGLKKNYMPKKTKRKESCWQDLLDCSAQVSDRIKNVFLINKDPADVAWAFGGPNSLIYCDVPSNSQIMDEDKHMKLAESLIGSKGKVVLVAQNCSMNKRLYANWNRKSVPGKPKESAWFNF